MRPTELTVGAEEGLKCRHDIVQLSIVCYLVDEANQLLISVVDVGEGKSLMASRYFG